MESCFSAIFDCETQRFWGTVLISILVMAMVALALGQMIWAYWSGWQERKRRIMATPQVVRFPVGLERKDQAVRVRVVKSSSRFPLRGLDRMISRFLGGGSISGF